MPGKVEDRLKAVARRYTRFVGSLPEPLAGQAKTLTKSLAPGYRHVAAYYGAKEAYPLLRFPLWLEDRYAAEGALGNEGRGADTATAALFGYLYIRIQDNVLDEPELFDSAYLLLANEFIAEFFRIYHGLFGPNSAFWDYFRRYWRSTSNNTLWERRSCAGRVCGFSEDDLARVGGKLDGAKTSVASVCMLAGHEQDIPLFEGVMDDLNIASQLHNDVVSFVKDLRHAYFTGVIADTLGGGEAQDGPDEVFRKASIKALTGDHLEGWLARAMEHNEDALKRVGPGGLPGLDTYVKSKNSHLFKLGRDLAQLKGELMSI